MVLLFYELPQHSYHQPGLGGSLKGIVRANPLLLPPAALDMIQ